MVFGYPCRKGDLKDLFGSCFGFIKDILCERKMDNRGSAPSLYSGSLCTVATKKEELKMKNNWVIFVFVLILSFVICSFNSVATGHTISETEAKKLILSANDFFCQYQDCTTFDHGLMPKTTTIEEVKSEARTIYTEDIADNMWMYQYCLNRNTVKEDDYILTFVTNEDGSITFIPFVPMSFRSFYICKDYSIPGMWQKADSLDSIKLKEITGDTQRAKAVVEVYKDHWDSTGEMVLMDVEFTNTLIGWRISGGSLVYAFSEESNSNLKYESVCGEHIFLDGYRSKQIVNYAAQSNDPDYMYTAVIQKNGYYHMMEPDEVKEEYGKMLEFDFLKAVSYDENKIIYLFINKLDGKTYDAVFSYDEKYEYEYPEYVWSSSVVRYKGCWRLTGGGVYDIVTGKNDVAPYTGDEAEKTLLFAVVISAISLFGMCVALKARKT